ncbi:hypothetical protein BC835DRAFT_1391279 [Cytidiella melzeri]|nr:hypothetical protein BC835DRAFT_1391279 [Cytidiella melzeri]
MSAGHRLAHLFKGRRHERSPLSIGQTLPDELILLILSNLAHDRLLEQHVYPISSLSGWSHASRAKKASMCQQGLYVASFLCRSWHSVGTELLYRAPFLPTKRTVHLLLRTITTSPHLATFMSDLHAPLVTEIYSLAWLRKSLKLKSAKMEVQEVADILTRLAQTTPSLHTLTLTHNIPSKHISSIPLSSIPFPPSLSHLCIHGTSFASPMHPQLCLLPSRHQVLDLTLSNMRSLCLREMYILSGAHLPQMPCVEKVVLVHNLYFPPSGIVAPERPRPLNSAAFPALRALEVYGDTSPTGTNLPPSLGCVIDTTALQRLDEFILVQMIGKLGDSLSLVKSSFDSEIAQLRSLTIGIVGLADCATLEKWSIPPSVEKLTILLSCTPSDSAEKHGGSQGKEASRLLRSLRRCLKLNTHFLVGLRELVLVFHPSAFDRLRDVEKVLGFRTAVGLSVVRQDLDQYVTQRLVVTESKHVKSYPLPQLGRAQSSDSLLKHHDIQHVERHV